MKLGVTKYVVSLVFQKIEGRDVNTSLRSKIVEAHSKEEALGKFIIELEEESGANGINPTDTSPIILKTILLIT